MIFEALKNIQMNGKDIKRGETFGLDWDGLVFERDSETNHIFVCLGKGSKTDVRDFKAVKAETVGDTEILLREMESLKDRKILFCERNSGIINSNIYFLDGEIPASLNSETPKSAAFRIIFFDLLFRAAFDIEGLQIFERRYSNGTSYLYRLSADKACMFADVYHSDDITFAREFAGMYHGELSMFNAFNDYPLNAFDDCPN